MRSSQGGRDYIIEQPRDVHDLFPKARFIVFASSAEVVASLFGIPAKSGWTATTHCALRVTAQSGIAGARSCLLNLAWGGVATPHRPRTGPGGLSPALDAEVKCRHWQVSKCLVERQCRSVSACRSRDDHQWN
jgi:hypothetical protein